MISRNDYIHYNLFGYNIKKFILAKEVMEFEKDVMKFISLSILLLDGINKMNNI
jgi:hypothetical protein